MCSAFTPECGFYNSTFKLIGDKFCPKRKCSSKLCLHTKTFQSLGRSDHQCLQCAHVCQVRKIPCQDQTSSFILSFRQAVYLFEESPKSIQAVIGDIYCPGKYCFNRENCETFDGYVTTPRSVYGKCGAWLFLHKSIVMLQGQVKTTRTDKTRFFFVKKL